MEKKKGVCYHPKMILHGAISANFTLANQTPYNKWNNDMRRGSQSGILDFNRDGKMGEPNDTIVHQLETRRDFLGLALFPHLMRLPQVELL